MTTPSGQISLSQVNTELGVSPASTLITMNQANVRALAGVPSGAITMANLQNKSSTFNATISANQTNLDLITYLTPLGYSPGGAASIIIGPGVYIYSTSTGNAGLTIPSAFGAGKLTLTNNGYIMGQGGNGASYLPNVAGTAGGVAMSISTPITLTNNSYIAGGGGGGGGNSPTGAQGGGGGAGGGAGGYMSTAPGGAGGGVGSAGGNGTLVSIPGPATFRGGGGGGRILPGTGGTGASGPGTPSTGGLGGGAGGGGGIQVNRLGGPAANFNKNAGGGGGGWGAAGGAGNQVTDLGIPAAATGGPGGSSNGAGSNGVAPSPNFFPGYAGGKAINLNGNVITYPATGTIWGTVS